MARGKAHTPEEIVAKLRQVEVLVGQGKLVADASRNLVRFVGPREQRILRKNGINSAEHVSLLLVGSRQG